jgi:hypothetical protein
MDADFKFKAPKKIKIHRHYHKTNQPGWAITSKQPGIIKLEVHYPFLNHVDVEVLILQLKDALKESYRISISNDDEEESHYLEELNGKPGPHPVDEKTCQEAQRQISQYLKDHTSSSTGKIKENIGYGLNLVQNSLEILREQGKIVRTGLGKRGWKGRNGFKYSLAGNTDDANIGEGVH